MKFKPWAAAALLAAAIAAPAVAAPVSLGDLTTTGGDTTCVGTACTGSEDFAVGKGGFTFELDFDVGVDTLLSVGFTNPTGAVKDLLVTLYSGAIVLASGASLTDLTLAAGDDYRFVVTGSSTSNALKNFSFDWATLAVAQQASASVPEPASVGLVAAALGALAVARRRRSAGRQDAS